MIFLRRPLSSSCFFVLLSCGSDEAEKPDQPTPDPVFEESSAAAEQTWFVPVDEKLWEEETLASGLDKAQEADLRLFGQLGDQLWYYDPVYGVENQIDNASLQAAVVYQEPLFFTDEGVFIWENDLAELAESPLSSIWTGPLVDGHRDQDGLWLETTDNLYRWTDDQLSEIDFGATLRDLAAGGNWVSASGDYESRTALWVSANQVHAVVATAAGPTVVASADFDAAALAIDRHDNVWAIDDDGKLYHRTTSWLAYTAEQAVTKLMGHPDGDLLWFQVGDETWIYDQEQFYTTPAPSGEWLSVDSSGRLLTLDGGDLKRYTFERSAGVVGLPRQNLSQPETIYVDPSFRNEVDSVFIEMNGATAEIIGPPWESTISPYLSDVNVTININVAYTDGNTYTTTFQRIKATPGDDDGDGYTEFAGDCNDADATIYPNAPEVVNDGIDQDCDGEDAIDVDLDGYLVEDDCDDNDATIYPDAPELCDEKDNDCDGEIDEGVKNSFYQDSDTDGYGTIDATVQACQAPAGYVDNGADCNDADASIHPLATESCDQLDNDCDGLIDDADPNVDTQNETTYYLDADGDGHGDPALGLQACQLPNGYSSSATDCDDSDAGLTPDDLDSDGYSTCDDDCDDSNPSLSPLDGDGDGYSTCDGDCDDGNSAISFSDNDGDGLSGCEGDCDDNDASLNPLDMDGDGVSSCDGDCDDSDAAANFDDLDADGYSTCDGDCDDTDASLHPADTDGDGESSCAGDCDDNDASLNNLDTDNDGYVSCVPESCYTLEMEDSYGDGWNGGALYIVLENGDLFNAYAAQGYGSSESFCISGTEAMYVAYQSGYYEWENTYTLLDAQGNVLLTDGPAPNTGLVYSDSFSAAVDCDDSDPNTNPDATDIPGDSIDQDCDGSDASGDGDGDGYLADQDCDDNDASLNFDDQDGDGYTTCPAATTCYTLSMQDSYGDGWNGGLLQLYIDGTYTQSYAAEQYESSADFCIAVGSQLELVYEAGYWEEENTYTLVDDAGNVLQTDGPSPAAGTAYSTVVTAAETDCNDQDAGIYPGASETPSDGIDQDCDGQDLQIIDADGDGSSAADDCDDNDPLLSTTDSDGDGYTTCPATTTCYGLSMQDSYGDGWNGGFLSLYVNQEFYAYFWATGAGSSETFCVEPGSSISLFYATGSWEMENTYQLYDAYGSLALTDGPTPTEGYVYSATAPEIVDCADDDATIGPTAEELAGDGIDQNCNGLDDE